jgi:hypothetical protein
MAGVLDVLEHSNIHQNQKQNRTMKKLLILLLLSVSASAQITLNLTSQNRTDLASLSDSLAAKQNKITGLTTNYLPKVGADGVLGNSIISEDDFRVGVGFANPLFSFDVRQFSPYTYNRASFGGMSPDGSSHGYILIPPNGGGFFDVIRRNNTDLRFATETSLGFGFSTQMTLTSDGKLGIKTIAPTHDLHVNGTTRTTKLLINQSTDSGEPLQVTGNIRVTNATDGIILKTPDGTKTFKLTIDNTGNIVSTQQ